MIGGISSIGAFDSASVSQLRQNMFSKIDKNGDGSLDKSELETFAQRTGKSVDDILKDMDADQDGVVTETEFSDAADRFEKKMETADFIMSMASIVGSGRSENSIIPLDDVSSDDIFDAIDSNSDGSIDKSELAASLEASGSNANVDDVLDTLDTDKDGTVSQSELASAIQQQIEDFESKLAEEMSNRLNKMANDIFDTIDSNSDGSVDKSELAASIEASGSSANVDDVFDTLDADKDGTVSQSEIASALQQQFEDFNNQVAQEMSATSATQTTDDLFASIDTNSDGSIDKSELAVAVNGGGGGGGGGTAGVEEEEYDELDTNKDGIVSQSEKEAAEPVKKEEYASSLADALSNKLAYQDIRGNLIQQMLSNYGTGANGQNATEAQNSGLISLYI